MTTNNSKLPDRLYENYLISLVGKFHKIMPMKEANDITLKKYMRSLLRELKGSNDLIIALDYNAYYMSLINTLQFLIDNDTNNEVCSVEIKKCISLIKKLITIYFGNEKG